MRASCEFSELIPQLDTLIYPIQYNTYDDLRGKQLSSENNQTGAAIYTMPNGESIYKAYERVTRYLRLTGGRFYEATSLKNLERSFAQIGEELRQQYVLGYYPKNQGSQKEKRQITLTVSNPDGQVHARESYVYKSGLAQVGSSPLLGHSSCFSSGSKTDVLERGNENEVTIKSEQIP